MAEQKPDRPQPKRPRPPMANGGLRFGRGLFGWVLFILLAIMLFILLRQGKQGYTQIGYGDFLDQLKADHVKTVTIEGEDVSGEFSSQQVIPSVSNKVSLFRTQFPAGSTDIWKYIYENHKSAKVEAENNNNIILQFILPLIP